MLIRKLLRTENHIQRQMLLKDAFRPRKTLALTKIFKNFGPNVMEGISNSQFIVKVSPDAFIKTCKTILYNFGNLLSFNANETLAERIRLLYSEAEVIATELYGNYIKLKDHQDIMWKEQTTSIFDLETLEINAENMGKTAPWTKPESKDIYLGSNCDEE